MHNEIGKVTKLIDEIISELMRNGSDEIDVKVKRSKESSTIYITDYNTKYIDDEIEQLSKILNVDRQCEIEEYYWGLVGNDNGGDELFLVGTMIDDAEVTKIGDNLYIKMVRVCKHKH